MRSLGRRWRAARLAISRAEFDTLLGFLLCLSLLLLVAIGEIWHELYGFLNHSHLFEIVVLAALAQLSWATIRRPDKVRVQVVDEDEAVRLARDLIGAGGIVKARIISAGLATRYGLLAEMVNR